MCVKCSMWLVYRTGIGSLRLKLKTHTHINAYRQPYCTCVPADMSHEWTEQAHVVKKQQTTHWHTSLDTTDNSRSLPPSQRADWKDISARLCPIWDTLVFQHIMRYSVHDFRVTSFPVAHHVVNVHKYYCYKQVKDMEIPLESNRFYKDCFIWFQWKQLVKRSVDYPEEVTAFPVF